MVGAGIEIMMSIHFCNRIGNRMLFGFEHKQVLRISDQFHMHVGFKVNCFVYDFVNFLLCYLLYHIHPVMYL